MGSGKKELGGGGGGGKGGGGGGGVRVNRKRLLVGIIEISIVVNFLKIVRKTSLK